MYNIIGIHKNIYARSNAIYAESFTAYVHLPRVEALTAAERILSVQTRQRSQRAVIDRMHSATTKMNVFYILQMAIWSISVVVCWDGTWLNCWISLNYNAKPI